MKRSQLKVCFKFLLFVCVIGFVLCEDVKKQTPKKNIEHVEKHHIPHRLVNNQEHWMYSFAWNIIGYCVILIPSFFTIRMIKTSNFYEKEGEGSMFKLIKCCVFGASKESLATSTKTSLFRCFHGNSSSAVTLNLLFCIVGLQVSYLTWGVLQEKVMTTKYGEGDHAVHFHNSEFLVFSNRVIALLVASLYMIWRGGNWNGPFYKYSFSSLSNICSSWCQYEALKFVSFPTQVLGKTSKMVPVMLMGKFVSRKTYHYYEYVVAVMISVGVSIFLLSSASDKHRTTETTISGFVLMIGYMLFDSFTSNWQAQMFSEYKVSSMQMMFNVNTFSALLTAVPLLLSGGMFSSIAFMMEYPSFATHVCIISLASATGQLFIFYTIAEFGALIFTIIMVTRQMFSILLSCFIYGHFLPMEAIFGVIIVFMALFLQIYAKYRLKQKQQQQQREQNLRESDMA